LPNGSDSSANRRYPVLYTLDGEAHFKRVVGNNGLAEYSARIVPKSRRKKRAADSARRLLCIALKDGAKN